MFNIFNHDTNALLGSLNEEQIAFLRGHLEEESTVDNDYYIMSPTVDLMEANGGDAALIALLRTAIGAADSVEIRIEPA